LQPSENYLVLNKAGGIGHKHHPFQWIGSTAAKQCLLASFDVLKQSIGTPLKTLFCQQIVPWTTSILPQKTSVPAPFEAAPFEAAPFEAAPFEAAPFEAAPFEAAPFEAAPFEAAPFEAAPFEAAPFEAAPFEAAPFEAAPFATPG